MKNSNLHYSGNGIAKWLSGYRDKWNDFYLSERWAFDTLGSNNKSFGRVLDVGCGMGGLAMAITSRYSLKHYHGVDINPQVIDHAETKLAHVKFPFKLQCGDILATKGFRLGSYDTVFSLSCADWNIETKAIINKCWEYVRPGGFFVISLRLTPLQGVNNIKRSFQVIDPDHKGGSKEIANYVVFNAREFFRIIEGLRFRPSKVYGYGYWGSPSKTATTLYKKLVFGVVMVQKSKRHLKKEDIVTHLNFPLDLFSR